MSLTSFHISRTTLLIVHSVLFHSRPFWICRSSQIHLLNHILQRCVRLEDNAFLSWSKYSLFFPCWALSGPCDDFWVRHPRPEHVSLLIGELLFSGGTLYLCFIKGRYVRKVTSLIFFRHLSQVLNTNNSRLKFLITYTRMIKTLLPPMFQIQFLQIFKSLFII